MGWCIYFLGMKDIKDKEMHCLSRAFSWESIWLSALHDVQMIIILETVMKISS